MRPRETLETARRLVGTSRRMVAFTGAGVSTASGVAAFRSPGGVWSRHRPVPFDEFLSSAEARRLGSSLVVYPAASLLPQAKAAGSRLVIVNRDSTPFDGLADVVLHGEVERLLPSLAPRDGIASGSGEE